MKLFLASVLLLASAPIVATADELKDTIIVTSSPHAPPDWCRASPVEKRTANANIEIQYEWISKNYPNTLGVVVNGDLTDTGRPEEVAEIKGLLSKFDKLDIPYFFGLGDNETKKNGENIYNCSWQDSKADVPPVFVPFNCDQNRCAIGAVAWLSEHIDSLRGNLEKKGKGANLVNFDSIQREGYVFPTKTIDIYGSLGYAVDLGRVYFIQLNDNRVEDKDWEVSNYIGVKGAPLKSVTTYNIRRQPVHAWLENRLEYAAQHDKIIMVNKHSASMDAGINLLLDRYKVRLRFAGHPVDGPLHDKTFAVGFSTERELLKLELDYVKNTLKVVNINLPSGDYAQERVVAEEEQIVKHPVHFAKGEYPKVNQIISVLNQGGYTGAATVSYFDPVKKEEITMASGRMNLGNIFWANVPKGATNVKASFENNTGWVGEPHKPVFGFDDQKSRIEWPYVPVLCFTTSGTTFSPWSSMLPEYDELLNLKVDQVNRC